MRRSLRRTFFRPEACKSRNHFSSQQSLGRFPKVRTGRPDHGRTSHFDKERNIFPRVFAENNLFHTNYLGFDWSGWIVLIKSEILNTTGMVWPLSSDKWKAPLDMTTALGLTPDSTSFKLHINFCCLIAKNFIWICRSKECFPIHNNFLFYLRHIYQLENKTPRNTKKWKPFFSSLGLVS